MPQHSDPILRQVKNESGSRCVKCLNRQTDLIEVTEHTNGVYNRYYCPNCGHTWCFKLRLPLKREKSLVDEIIYTTDPVEDEKKSITGLYRSITDGGLSHGAAELFREAHRNMFSNNEELPKKTATTCRSCNHTFTYTERGNVWVECPMCRQKIRVGDEGW